MLTQGPRAGSPGPRAGSSWLKFPPPRVLHRVPSIKGNHEPCPCHKRDKPSVQEVVKRLDTI